LVPTTFYGVSATSVPLYGLAFSIGNLLGPLILGPLFDTVGRHHDPRRCRRGVPRDRCRGEAAREHHQTVDVGDDTTGCCGGGGVTDYRDRPVA
jgi:hypothetical protein